MRGGAFLCSLRALKVLYSPLAVVTLKYKKPNGNFYIIWRRCIRVQFIGKPFGRYSMTLTSPLALIGVLYAQGIIKLKQRWRQVPSTCKCYVFISMSAVHGPSASPTFCWYDRLTQRSRLHQAPAACWNSTTDGEASGFPSLCCGSFFLRSVSAVPQLRVYSPHTGSSKWRLGAAHRPDCSILAHRVGLRVCLCNPFLFGYIYYTDLFLTYRTLNECRKWYLKHKLNCTYPRATCVLGNGFCHKMDPTLDSFLPQ